MTFHLDAPAIMQLREHGYLPASEMARLGGAGSADLTPGWLALLEESLPLAVERSHSPVSSFRVGAAALGQIDARYNAPALYFGANLEFPGLPLHNSVHAEQAAVAHAWLHGEKGVLAVAANAAPCGHCRQFLLELGEPSSLSIVIPGEPARALADLLPVAFDPSQLGVNMRWMQAPFVSSGFEQGAEAYARELAAASFAPYTHVRAAVVLVLKGGECVGGAAVESVAYNPSLGPMHVALSQLALRAPQRKWSEVETALLVESEGLISYRASSEQILRAIAPGSCLETVPWSEG